MIRSFWTKKGSYFGQNTLEESSELILKLLISSHKIWIGCRKCQMLDGGAFSKTRVLQQFYKQELQKKEAEDSPNLLKNEWKEQRLPEGYLKYENLFSKKGHANFSISISTVDLASSYCSRKSCFYCLLEAPHVHFGFAQALLSWINQQFLYKL